MKHWQKFRAICHAFARAEEGAVLPLIGLGAIVLVGAAGAAVDMGTAQIVESRMHNALDAAGLAVGSEASTVDMNTETGKYFYANFPNHYMGTTITSLTATPNATNSLITLTATGTVNTTFMRLLNINTVNVGVTTQITRQAAGMELVLVLDNTGSMNSPVNPSNSSVSKIAALKSAASALLDVLYGGANKVPNLWVGLVPFSQTVNVGTGHPDWMDAAYDAGLDFGPTIVSSSCPAYTGTSPSTPGTYSSGPKCRYTLSGSAVPNFGFGGWKGCVMARSAPYDTSDDPPSTRVFKAYNFPYTSDNGNPIMNYWKVIDAPYTSNGHTTRATTYDYSNSSWLGTNRGPNAECPKPVTPMVAEKSTVVTAINALQAAGSTVIDIGMAWGWRMLSPRWRGLWGGQMDANALPLDYHTPLMNKVVILMTDGMNSVATGNYTAYGFLSANELGTTSVTQANAQLDTRTLAVCSALKANGVLVYTIGFGSTDVPDINNTTSVNGPMLKSCATKLEYYFFAPTNAQLIASFQKIGDSLSNLFISK